MLAENQKTSAKASALPTAAQEATYVYGESRGHEFAKKMAHPEAGDEIVITGLAGVFPDSENVYHFRDNLYNKVDMISCDDRRWPPTHPEIPQRTGKLYDCSIKKFDAGYFGTHFRQTHSMDPMGRLFMERAIEAILDAGINPAELENTRTGVFVGACFCETEKSWFFDQLYPQYFGITGCIRSMIANRLSYHLKLKGPSFIIDTACSSSLFAIQHAYDAIRNGNCDRAIVGGTNVCVHPYVSLQFARLGVLSPDGACKVFDERGDGYARSEAVCAVVLQKSSEARRIYSEVLHAKSNCDGYKEQGITYPSGATQKQLLHEFYQDCQIDPTTLSYLEAHGTGTRVGDPEEVAAIDEIFCKNRPTPLLVGSVKSNIGHTEPSSGLCSITKAILSYENGLIPPNINFTRVREGVEALETGRLKVVTEPTPFQDDRALIGVNSFGFGGANAHVLLKGHGKEKRGDGPGDDLPRLVCVSGRVPESITAILDDLSKRKLDAEYVRLYHQIFAKDIPGHIHRGYSILSKTKGELKRSSRIYLEPTKPLLLVFGNFGTSCLDLIRNLYVLPQFAASCQRVHNILTTGKNYNVTRVILNRKRDDPPLGGVDQTIANLLVQIGLVDVLRTLHVKFDGYFGCGLGEFVAGYFDDALTLEECVLGVYAVATALRDAGGSTASYLVRDGVTTLPADVHVTEIHPDGVVLTGDAGNLDKFVAARVKLGVSVQAIASDNFHSTGFNKHKPQLLNDLAKIIPEPGRRSAKWLSPIATTNLADPDYFLRSLTRIVNFSEKETILELGTGHVSQSLSLRGTGFVDLLDVLGRLYEIGQNPRTDKLYPKVQYPVSRGTPMISPLIKWNHSNDWYVTYYRTQDSVKTGERSLWMSLKDDDWVFVGGHVIDGRNLFPATGYLSLTWEALALSAGMITTDLRVVFENCKFLRATNVFRDTKIELTVMIQRASGNFEVIADGTAIVTGRIYISKRFDEEQLVLPLPIPTNPAKALPLSSRDIYKELRLRGYNYKGAFRLLQGCDASACTGSIHWDGNWMTYMDNMLQMKILQLDTRLLYVPTTIKRLSVDFSAHIAYAQTFDENQNLPVYIYPENDTIKSGAIEIRGLMASSIAKRKPRGEPVLEKYVFVPNIATHLTTAESVRVNVQIALENVPGVRVKVVELVDDSTMAGCELLAPMIHAVLGDLPLIQSNITVLTKRELEIPDVLVEDKKLVAEKECHLVVGSNVLQRPIIMHQAFGALKAEAFVISRESLDFRPTEEAIMAGVEIITVHTTDHEQLIMFRQTIQSKSTTTMAIDVAQDESVWLESLQEAVKKQDSDVVVYAQNAPQSGVLGLVNCLRREPGGLNVRSVFIMDPEARRFDVDHPFYGKHLSKHLAVNVLKHGQWGTYRHLLLEDTAEVDSEHCFINVTVRGDLSSLRWIEGPLRHDSVMPSEQELVHIYYTSLNFRDIMTASGRINADVVTRDRLKQECVQGFEYSGRTSSGKRVFGMVVNGALANLLNADKYLLWDVPDFWTLEEAATIPVVYGTVLFAFFVKCSLKRGDSVLIHAGSGGIGQAAISIALHYGCTVYTTVGTGEKRAYLKKRFPQLTDRNIGNSRDTTFEQLIKTQTKGRGVDYVLNSLSEEKMQASLRCLARGGHFLEIGKFDLANDNTLNLMLLEKEASFHGIMVDQFFDEQPRRKQVLRDLMKEGVLNGAIKPLQRVTFQENEIEQAFRYMASGKHTGKVTVVLRKEEADKLALPRPKIMRGLPRYSCDFDKVYVIVGGLGGFGLELADWLVLRGARKLVLTSRSGVKTGYQSLRIRIWSDYGAEIIVSTADVTTREGCQELLREANRYGQVEAIFNLAVVLKDALFENQTLESFRQSFAPKAVATQHLDALSRVLCPHLQDFVIFSSVSCGRGNAGQTNYGMANSIMERICEMRHADGLPALAVEWGAIGDVGLVAEMQEEHTEMEIGGTLQQKISNCLEVLDKLLKQKNAIVSSMVVAEKRSGAGGADNIVDAVANILGLRDLKVISMHATLAELGMDSMTAVEIKQTLEREFEVFLTPQDIRAMTFARLQEIQEELSSDATDEGQTAAAKKDRPLLGFEMLVRHMDNEDQMKIDCVDLCTRIESDLAAPTVIIFPGIEGVAKVLESLTFNLNCHAKCLQFRYDRPEDTICDLARNQLSIVETLISKTEPFNFVAYSFGCVVALELVSMLEARGYTGTLILIDGAPDMLVKLLKSNLDVASEAVFQTGYLFQIMSLYMPMDAILKHKDRLLIAKNFDERLNIGDEIMPKDVPHSRSYLRSFAVALYKRLEAIAAYRPTFDSKIKSTVKLFKPSVLSVSGLAEDYRLSDLIQNPVEVSVFKGNHATILDNLEMAETVDKVFGVAPKVPQEVVFPKKSIMEAAERRGDEVKQI